MQGPVVLLLPAAALAPIPEPAPPALLLPARVSVELLSKLRYLRTPKWWLSMSY